MSNTSQLVLTNRLYRYIKSSAVVGLVQAGVELVTNADDAYRKSGLEAPHYINIVVDYQGHDMTVYDQAVGLTGADMVKCFGQVGEYTSDIIARGYFSRGAKDITAIGFATFVGVKDGKISEVTISTNDEFTKVRMDHDVTAADRSKYNITKNGLWVNLNVKDSIAFPSYEDMSSINKYYSMRDIFSDSDNRINIKVISTEGYVLHDGRLQYSRPPVSKILIDEEFLVEGYPDAKATFKLWLYEKPVDDVEYTSYMEHGITVSSVNALHEVSTLYSDIRNHPYIRHVYGRLDCEYINKLMYDFENKPDDSMNPFPIIDHSRTKGLDRAHPFTKALFRVPHKQLSYVLQDLYGRNLINNDLSNNLSSIFKNVELFGMDFFQEMANTLYPYVSTLKSSKIVGYLKKQARSGAIISSNPTSEYSFDKETNFDEKSDNTGSIVPKPPSLNIIFTDKEFLTYPYYIYRLQNTIYLEININDFMVSKYIQKNEHNEIIILDKSAASVLLVDIISEAMAREALKEREMNTRDERQMNDTSADSVFQEMEKIKALLVPKLYDIIVTKNMEGIHISSTS